MKKSIAFLGICFLLFSAGLLAISISVFSILSPNENANGSSKGNLKEFPHLALDISWDTNGTSACTAPEYQGFIQLCTDGAGGAIIVWKDERSETDFDIYAQHIDSDGDIHWGVSGYPICDAINDQENPKLCSDGAGGAIIVWEDYRGSVYDIYAQHINSEGVNLWGLNGISICSTAEDKGDAEICSDGAGGAIITWHDYRGAKDYNIYTQHINSEGVNLWGLNGMVICDATEDQYLPKICSDGLGGAIIVWEDYRNGTDYDIYAQHINSEGIIEWGSNGTDICTAVDDQINQEICSDSVGGAVIVWEDERTGLGSQDIYAQHIDSEGVTQWASNGTDISIADDIQRYPEICSDGAGGAIIVWEDYRSITDWDIYIQHINSIGHEQWLYNGMVVCDAINTQINPRICSDGVGGVIITWQDYRDGDYNIYAQHINSTGQKEWVINGVTICNVTEAQANPNICRDELGGAIIAWLDHRSGTDYDIFVQKLENAAPTSNHPADVKTSWEGTETINWTLSDDSGGGQYRVLANLTGGSYSIVHNWTSWNSDTTINVQINRTNSGIFAYRIEYYDNQNRSGVSDTVIVTIQNNIPSSNHPEDFTTTLEGAETINWILYDDYGGGQYRVWVNDTKSDSYVWVNWTPWINNTLLNIPINRTTIGIYNYTIEYYDNQNRFGVPDTVVVTIQTNIPSSNHPEDLSTKLEGSETINWILYDDYGGGKYRVLVNDTNGDYYIWVDWTPWTNNTLLNVPINRTTIGIYNYIIEYYDNNDQFGNPDNVLVVITEETPPSIPGLNVILISMMVLFTVIFYVNKIQRKRNWQQ
ncbi:MAG: hypothetical protein ACFFDH_08220 [Promethearchaeota archaeon]